MKPGTCALTLTFFHDVVCAWCFNLSPRLRALSTEFNLDIRHRTFVLQDSPTRMAETFGSAAEAKSTILEHWAACAAASDTPERFSIDRMRNALFDYPHGLVAAMACQVAQTLGGPEGHWRLFDALQRAHISESRNVADTDVVLSVARKAGFDMTVFAQGMKAAATRHAVEADRALARQLGVRSVPTVIVEQSGARLRNGTLEDLRAQLDMQLSLVTATEVTP